MHKGIIAGILLSCAAASALAAEPLRGDAYPGGTPDTARAWQNKVRGELFDLLKLGDLWAARESIPLEPEIAGEEMRDGYALRKIHLRATPTRVFDAVLALPDGDVKTRPAVVCMHGHGGDSLTPFDLAKPEYKAFGDALARRGFVAISTYVGQHQVYESGRTLMGERLWDLIRCVDYLESREDVDGAHIGCAGLSFGGEMAMWLGAMDTRIAATVSCGFLTLMDQMEQNHCMCWKFDGLRERVDFPDIYGLIAPRALQCQNGRKEPETQFHVPLAEKAMREVMRVYADFGAPQQAVLHVHEGGHEIDRDALIAFLERHLGVPK